MCSAYRSSQYLSRFLNNINELSNSKDLTLYLVLNDPDADERRILQSQRSLNFRLVIHEVERESISRSTNRGFQLATDDYIGYTDVDDLHPPSTYVAMLNTLETCDVTYGDYQEMFPDGRLGRIHRFEDDTSATLYLTPIFGPTHFFRRSALAKVGFWDEQLISAADFDWQIRALSLAKVRRTAQLCTFYNVSPISASRGQANRIENLVLALRYKIFRNIGSYIENLDGALGYELNKTLYNGVYHKLPESMMSKIRRPEGVEASSEIVAGFGMAKPLRWSMRNTRDKIFDLKKLWVPLR